MPTYDYFCSECKHGLEVFHKMTDEPLQECPQCLKKTLVRKPGGGIGLAKSTMTVYSSNEAPKGGCCPCGKNKGSCSS